MPVITAIHHSRTALLRARTSSSSPWAPRAQRALTSPQISTFHHPEYNIPISLPDGLSQAQLLSFRPFTASLAAQHSRPGHPFRGDPSAPRSVMVQAHDLSGGARDGGGEPGLVVRETEL
ncbi:hypothetical protein VTH06DRAFT_8311, partial [Thermothelomyces fergusii]